MEKKETKKVNWLFRSNVYEEQNIDRVFMWAMYVFAASLAFQIGFCDLLGLKKPMEMLKPFLVEITRYSNDGKEKLMSRLTFEVSPGKGGFGSREINQFWASKKLCQIKFLGNASLRIDSSEIYTTSEVVTQDWDDGRKTLFPKGVNYYAKD